MINISKEEYINNAKNKPYVAENVLTIIEKIKNNEPFIFAKAGDAEFNAMTLNNINGRNADNDVYTYDNGIELRKAICELADRSSDENIYLAQWHSDDIRRFYHELYYDYLVNNNKDEKYIPWVDFHFVYPDQHFASRKDMLFEFLKTIQETSLLKIVISNIKNIKHQIIFKSDEFIEVAESCWYANGDYNKVKNTLIDILNKNKDRKALLLTSVGMCGRILINDITKLYPTLSVIDIGSAFDILSRKYPTRSWDEIEGYHNSYEKQFECFKELLPPDF